MAYVIEVLAVIGFVLAVYAFYVEKKKENEKDYQSACDINDRFSCTRAFSSKYGKTFGLSNSIWGMFFYIIVIVLTYLNLVNYIFYLSIISFLGTLYLAYTLYFKLRDVCIVCTAIYIVNILLLIFSYLAVY